LGARHLDRFWYSGTPWLILAVVSIFTNDAGLYSRRCLLSVLGLCGTVSYTWFFTLRLEEADHVRITVVPYKICGTSVSAWTVFLSTIGQCIVQVLNSGRVASHRICFALSPRSLEDACRPGLNEEYCVDLPLSTIAVCLGSTTKSLLPCFSAGDFSSLVLSTHFRFHSFSLVLIGLPGLRSFHRNDLQCLWASFDLPFSVFSVHDIWKRNSCDRVGRSFLLLHFLGRKMGSMNLHGFMTMILNGFNDFPWIFSAWAF
jgi:hypothetical protein